MKRLYITIINVLLCALILMINFSLVYRNKFNPFEKEDVLNNIEYLTSDELEGRLCGNEGNYLAQDFIEKSFIKSNIKEFNSTYLQDFKVKAPILIEGDPYLKVYDKNNNLIVSYKYGVDFKEAFINFRVNNISFDNTNEFKAVPSAIKGTSSSNNSVVFLSSPIDSFNFRSSFIENTPCDLYVLVAPDLIKELEFYLNKGYRIDCFLPYKVEEKEVNNIAGVIKGKNPLLPPLVLTAHFDHMGKGISGEIYRGALDNASGASFLLELSSFLASLPQPSRDIIVVSLNAEEFGLLGSKNFAEENKSLLKGATVINFDMIGSDKNVPLTFMNGEGNCAHSYLLDRLCEICNQKKITTIIENKDSSDHASFIKEGLDSITINDGDITRIHTPEDTIEYISPTAIDRSFSVVWSEIFSTSYSSSGLFLLDLRILVLLILSVLLCIILKLKI
ncbi:M28 family metallopeptidase [Clostridium sp. LIBA-8841]|uniref:M28 family metallopeptidase n=1 Tax=Clostridium sp. LIBA-8841 TaxID=2987530 RepID=UPI002AC6DE51|nr:M28 family metallopeptidase [Clostridium sp. LIBA-8841]MDZ5253119.1 M28 family metallopeptidase [Clostridium sp. LIBA-8841]